MLIDLFTKPADQQAEKPFVPTSQAPIVANPDPRAVEAAWRVESATREVQVQEVGTVLAAEMAQLDAALAMIDASNTVEGLTTESLVFAHLAITQAQQRLHLAEPLLDVSALESGYATTRTVVSTTQLRSVCEHMAQVLDAPPFKKQQA